MVEMTNKYVARMECSGIRGGVVRFPDSTAFHPGYDNDSIDDNENLRALCASVANNKKMPASAGIIAISHAIGI